VRATASRVSPDEVKLVPGRTVTMEGQTRLYWHIHYAGRRAGHVSIDYSESGGRPKDASIDILLNARSRGRGIGTVAFRQACELSGLPEVVASIRKSNVASQIAAQRAGFVSFRDEPSGELLMTWKRS
jgi:RimJ/RimL family protein N-acetyltransferase